MVNRTSFMLYFSRMPTPKLMYCVVTSTEVMIGKEN